MNVSKELYPKIDDGVLEFFKKVFPKSNSRRNFLGLPEKDMDPDLREKYRRSKIMILKRATTKIKRIDSLFLYENQNLVTSGSQKIDDLLDGGFKPGRVYEIYGQSGTGKTQLCLTVALYFASSKQGKVIYYSNRDTKNCERVKEMYEYLKKENTQFMTLQEEVIEDEELVQEREERSNIEETLDSIKFGMVTDFYDLFDKLVILRKSKNRKNLGNSSFYNDLGVVIIDSIDSLIIPLYQVKNRCDQGVCQMIMDELRNLALSLDISVLITNGATAKNLKYPALGHQWQLMQSLSLGLYAKCDIPTGKFFRTCCIGKGSTENYEKIMQIHIHDGGVCDPPIFYTNERNPNTSTLTNERTFDETTQITMGGGEADFDEESDSESEEEHEEGEDEDRSVEF